MKTAKDARNLLKETAEEYRKILKENLVGIYEHGSLSFGCFRWEVSDIDFLAVVRRPLTQAEKEGLICTLLEHRESAPDKGVEMSVVLQEHLKPFVYPTPFELHYSNAHLDGYLRDVALYCEGMNGADKDLAAHCTVIREKGRTVIGEKIGDVFGEVPKSAYLDSILFDVESAEEDIPENPVYVTLNLCRVLAAAREGLILSKAEGGRWGADRLDGRWREFVLNALSAYENGSVFQPNAETACQFARMMLGEIDKQIKDQSLE